MPVCRGWHDALSNAVVIQYQSSITRHPCPNKIYAGAYTINADSNDCAITTTAPKRLSRGMIAVRCRAACGRQLSEGLATTWFCPKQRASNCTACQRVKPRLALHHGTQKCATYFQPTCYSTCITQRRHSSVALCAYRKTRLYATLTAIYDNSSVLYPHKKYQKCHISLQLRNIHFTTRFLLVLIVPTHVSQQVSIVSNSADVHQRSGTRNKIWSTPFHLSRRECDVRPT